jgi:hypothetical protein
VATLSCAPGAFVEAASEGARSKLRARARADRKSSYLAYGCLR